MTDGLNMQERVREPESELEPGVMAVKSRRAAPVRFLVNATGVVDTSISGGILMLQQPPRWSHDFDPDTLESRASLPSVIPVFDNPPATTTPPEGSSDLTVATTEFVDRACNAAVIRAVMESKHGSDGRFPAAPGDIGEFLSVAVPSPGVELTASTFVPVAQMTLAPGEWFLTATAAFALQGGIGPYANMFMLATIAETPTFGGFHEGVTSIAASPYSSGTDICLPVGLRVLTGVEKTMFLLAYCAGFATPVRMFAYGFFQARRVR